MTLGLLAASLFILFAGAGVAQSQAAPGSLAQSAGASTVGIIASGVDSTGIRIASDLSRLLDGNDLRVIPILGKGTVQDLNDLSTLKSADIAIVQSDVMARALADSQSGMQSRVKYIAKLYSEDFQVLSRMQFLCLADLNGRRVSFGPKGSGPAITAEAVFEANNISPAAFYFEHGEAVERLKRGELDALVYVSGKPSHAFDSISHKDKVHFLDVEYLPALQANYLPAIITPEDYPNLVAPSESVATIGVSYVMAVYGRPRQPERYKVMSLFVERFLSSYGKLNASGFSPRWAEVNLRAPVKGWQRFEAAEDWLVANAQPAAEAAPQTGAARMKTMLRKFVESRKSASSDQEEFFNQFVLWYREYGVQTPQQW
jgi:TRAP transporter TAXI family solute receptor